MKAENINKSVPHKILIAPLDWGLGHATRCVPIIKEFTRQGAEVIIASGKSTTPLLQIEFPNLTFVPIDDYSIKYAKKGSLVLKLIRQIPRISRMIKYENKWLMKLIRDHRITAVISDNRFGLFNSSVPCVYITHQLQFKTSGSIVNKLMQSIHYRFINRFTECWVPDDENAKLSGDMARPEKMPLIPVRFTGILSRLSRGQEEKKYDFLLLLSGPEPQRTVLENILLKEFKEFDKSFAVVRGLPGSKLPIEYQNKNAIIYDHLDAEGLSKLICQSKVIISRSGYSTVMDLSKLGSRAIFIPTPGQAEQEYLSDYLNSKNFCETISQKDISLRKVLKLNEKSFEFPVLKQPDTLEKLVKEFLTRLD